VDSKEEQMWKKNVKLLIIKFIYCMKHMNTKLNK